MNCPLCQSSNLKFLSGVKDVEYWTVNDTFSYYECLSCQIIFLKDPPQDKLSEIYPNTYYSTDFDFNKGFSVISFLSAVKLFLDKKFLRQALSSISGKEQLSCLDIGGGSGWMLNILRMADTRVGLTSVIDLNPISRDIAQKNGHTFYCQNIESANFRNQFDVVLMLNLIEHLSDPKGVLAAINIAMRPGGLAIIKTPNSCSWNRKIFKTKYWGGYHAPRHWIIFNEKNFRKLCEEVGFVVQKLTYAQGATQWAASILGTYFSDGKKNLIMHKRFSFSLLIFFFGLFDFLTLPFKKTDQIFVELRKKID